ncbi:MAG: hypothetical protein ACYSU6_06445 [Planctomycetota bacterium]|jgi:hypothetical protein
MEKRFVFHTCIALLLLSGPWLTWPALANSTWNVQTVDSTSDVGRTTSIALDKAGQPHISYIDYTKGGLKYAAFNGSTWDIQTVASTGVSGYTAFTAIALDAAGRPHISYDNQAKEQLNYAAFNGSTWDIQTIDSSQHMGSFTALSIWEALHHWPSMRPAGRTSATPIL